MFAPVHIRTGSRLHFGPLAVGAPTGRTFGGIGLMLDEPALELVARPATHDDCVSGAVDSTEALILLRGARQRQPQWALPPVAIDVRRSIPRHRGLGSGTQFALATAQAACGTSVVPARQLARWTDRGQRSAIGVHGFEHGGFLVDAGKRDAASLGVLAARAAFPPEWPILLWIPGDHAGLSGAAERSAFARLPHMPAHTTDRLCAVVLRELLPALAERDWQAFSGGLGDYGRLVGEYFAAAQGGVWADPRAAGVVEWLARQGLYGTAQSSWGPTIAAILPDADTAGRIRETWPFGAETLLVTQARNRGADVAPLGEAARPAGELSA